MKMYSLEDEPSTPACNKWRDIPCLWMQRLNIVKILVLHNLIYRFSANSIKNPAIYFVDTDKFIPKFNWKGKDPNIQQNIEEQSRRSWYYQTSILV